MKRKEAILRLRKVLVKRRNALRKALAGDLSSLQELRGEPGGDAIDAALDSAHFEINSQLAEIESRELVQIEKALERMRNGTYGICELTGRSIPLARLQALPYTTVCVEAQRELEETGEAETEGADWGRLLDTEPATAEDVLPISDLDF